MIVPGGLTRLYDWPEEDENLLESGTPWRLHASFKLTPGGGLRLDANLPTTTVPSATRPIDLDPGWYALRSRAQAAGNTKGSARVQLRVGREQGPSTDGISGTVDWRTIERKFILVSEAAACQVRVEAYQKPDGVFEFEKIELRKLIPPKVQCFVRFPNYRGMLWDDAPQTIKVWVSVRPEAKDALLRVVGQDGTLMFSAGLPVGDDVVPIDATHWPLGRYALIVTAEGFSYPDFMIVKASASEREGAFIDADGYLVTSDVDANAQPAPRRQFVLGAYDTVGAMSALPAVYKPTMDRLQASGGSVWLNYLFQNIQGPSFRTAIAEHARRGLLYIQCWNRVFERNAENWAKLAVNGKLASQFESEEALWRAKAQDLGAKGLPGFLGWYIADELPADRADEIFHLYRTMAEEQPQGVCFAANNSIYGATLYRDCVDVLDVHSYPIWTEPEGTLSPLEQSFEAVSAAVAAVQDSRPVWAALQDCILAKAGHFPTIDELRFLAWSAVVAGAKGIMWWGLGTMGGAIGGAPVAMRAGLLARLALVNAEITALEDALLSPSVEATSSLAAVKVMAKLVDGIAHLWAVNVSPETVSVTIGTAGRSVTMTLAPYDVWLQAEPVDPVWLAAQAATTDLVKAGLVRAEDRAASSLVVARAFDGFTRGGAA